MRVVMQQHSIMLKSCYAARGNGVSAERNEVRDVYNHAQWLPE
jgi:hypothetical protein